MQKSAIIESISKLPDEVTLDEVIERLIILDKIERGRQQIEENKINPEEKARGKLDLYGVHFILLVILIILFKSL